MYISYSLLQQYPWLCQMIPIVYKDVWITLININTVISISLNQCHSVWVRMKVSVVTPIIIIVCSQVSYQQISFDLNNNNLATIIAGLGECECKINFEYCLQSSKKVWNILLFLLWLPSKLQKIFLSWCLLLL